MGDVSCRMFAYFTAAAEAGVVDMDVLLADLPTPPEILRDPRARVPWDDWLALVHRFESLLPPDADLVALSRDLSHRDSVFQPVMPLTRWALSTTTLYEYGLRIAATTMFSGIAFTSERVGRDLRVQVRIPTSMTPSRAWLDIFAGALIALPHVVGLPDAQVLDSRRTDRTLDMMLRADRKTPLGVRLRQAWYTLIGSEKLLTLLDEQSADVRSIATRADDAAREAAGQRATVDALAAALPDLVLRVDARGRLMGFLAGTGFPEADLLEVCVGRELDTVAEGAADPGVRSTLAAIHRTVTRGVDTPMEVRTPGPPPRVLEVRCVPSTQEAFVVLVRDITETERLREQLAVTERLATLGTLAAGAAHEINNPLTYVMMNLSLAQDALTGDRRQARALRAVTDALDGTERIARIVRDMQAFSRTESARLQAVEVDKAVAQALRLTAHAIDDATRVEVDVAGLPRVRADPDQMVQVLVNLLTNAAHAIDNSPRLGGTIRVTGAAADDGRVRLSVRDDGCGMTEDVLARALDPFFTTRRGTGTGLGLPIVRRIMGTFDGGVSIASTPDVGTTVTLSFRAAMPAPEDPAEPTTESDGAPASRILIVDDDPPVRQAMAAMLDPHAIVEAGSAEEALELLGGDHGFDLVLCDLIMPGTNGVELYEAAVTQAPSLRDRFVFVTGGTPDPGLAAALEATGRPCLRKPFRRRRLRRDVDLALLAILGRTP